jgi:hypothetical protein
MLSCVTMAFNVVFFVVTASLVVQLVVLALLLYGYMLFRKLKFREHGVVMAWAVFVHLASVLGIMIPSLVYAVLPEYIFVNLLELASVLGLIHVVLGASTLGMGVWFVASWRFRSNFTGCFGKRRAMLATMILWATALVFGIALYTVFNWNVLMP